MKKSIQLNKNVKISNGIILIIFFMLFIFVEIPVKYFHASSNWEGIAVGMFTFIIISMAISKYYKYRIKTGYLKIIGLFFFILIVQYMIDSFIFINLNNFRFVITYFSFGLLFIISMLFINIINMTEEKVFHNTILSAYKLLVGLGILSIFIDRNMIIFSEPSHFALVYLPLLLYMAYTSRSLKRIFHLSIGFIFAFLIKDLTLLTGIVLILILLYRRAIFVFIPSVIIMFIIANMDYIKHNYFISRIRFFSNHNNNLSSLVYISGWQRAYLSFFKSYGLGLGFDQMGFVGPKGSVINYMVNNLHMPRILNLFDGGTLAPKIIAELGVLGIVLIITYFYFFIYMYNKFVKRKIIYKSSNIFFSSVFVMFSLALFVRADGYFMPITFMFLASIYWFYLNRKGHII